MAPQEGEPKTEIVYGEQTQRVIDAQGAEMILFEDPTNPELGLQEGSVEFAFSVCPHLRDLAEEEPELIDIIIESAREKYDAAHPSKN